MTGPELKAWAREYLRAAGMTVTEAARVAGMNRKRLSEAFYMRKPNRGVSILIRAFKALGIEIEIVYRVGRLPTKTQRASIYRGRPDEQNDNTTEDAA